MEDEFYCPASCCSCFYYKFSISSEPFCFSYCFYLCSWGSIVECRIIWRDINNIFRVSIIFDNSKLGYDRNYPGLFQTLWQVSTLLIFSSVTESVYSHFTLADFDKNKAVNEFLDYDRESLFRKNGQYCGIRNIDNSTYTFNSGCYLSVTLQILYNIQGLRERVFKVPEANLNNFIK